MHRGLQNKACEQWPFVIRLLGQGKRMDVREKKQGTPNIRRTDLRRNRHLSSGLHKDCNHISGKADFNVDGETSPSKLAERGLGVF